MRRLRPDRPVHADALAIGPAKKLVDRQPGGLPGDIPEGHVDPADRAEGDRATLVAIPARIHRIPEGLAAQRILAEQEWFEAAHLRDDAVAMILQERFAETGNAPIGMDAQPHPARWHFQDLQMGDTHDASCGVAEIAAAAS
jgi:hypothetical protein